ncbi:Apolipoprotein A-IV [Bienertia sinuspersici]
MSTTTIEPTSSLYLHPFNGSNSIVVYKLLGVVVRDSTDKVKQEAWGICNSMIICWILQNVSETIRKFIMYVSNAKENWRQLQQRYQVTSGVRRYQLNKQIYETKQNGKPFTEYFY